MSGNTELVLEAKQEESHGKYIGNCKWFSSKLGYGFIRVCNGDLKGTDVFVHHSAIHPLNSSFKTLYKGEYVHFNIGEGRLKEQAIDVTGILGGPLMCDHITAPAAAIAAGMVPPAEFLQAPAQAGMIPAHVAAYYGGGAGAAVPPPPPPPPRTPLFSRAVGTASHHKPYYSAPGLVPAAVMQQQQQQRAPRPYVFPAATR